MTTVANHCRFRRTAGMLWRDTGRHVLAIPPGNHTEVVVLGGGGALVWRILAEPRDLHELEAALAGLGEAPDTTAIQECLDDLVARRLVTRGQKVQEEP